MNQWLFLPKHISNLKICSVCSRKRIQRYFVGDICVMCHYTWQKQQQYITQLIIQHTTQNFEYFRMSPTNFTR